MIEVVSTNQSNKLNWPSRFLVAICAIGFLVSIYDRNPIWISASLAAFFGWLMMYNSRSHRLLFGMAVAIIGLTLACTVDAMTFNEALSNRGMHNIRFKKVAYYFVAAVFGALLGVNQTYETMRRGR